jgi:arylamine N-acetyltransferase
MACNCRNTAHDLDCWVNKPTATPPAVDPAEPVTAGGATMRLLLRDAYGADYGAAIVTVERQAAQHRDAEIAALREALENIRGLTAEWDQVSEWTMRLALSNIQDEARRALRGEPR